MIKPWLWLPASWTHTAAPLALKCLARVQPSQTIQWKPFSWRGITFPNRIGLAAGADKDAMNVSDWWKFGVGFSEVGTVVPEAQGPNQGKIVDRDIRDYSVWNRMGFPSKGCPYVEKRLTSLSRPYSAPLLINIGKNRNTPLELAHDDYSKLIVKLHPYADAFVLNISSPNTAGLRQLFTSQYFSNFLKPILQTREQTCPQKPLLVKLSPDLTDNELEYGLKESLHLGIDGWVLTNTTQSRNSNSHYPTGGGISGGPLTELSRKQLEKSIQILGTSRSDKLLVSVGGIFSAEEVQRRLDIGADLVEIYSALIFEGPWLFKKILHKLQSKTYNSP